MKTLRFLSTSTLALGLIACDAGAPEPETETRTEAAAEVTPATAVAAPAAAHPKAQEVRTRRPDLAKQIDGLQPSTTRSGHLRFLGKELRDADAMWLFVERFQNPQTSVAEKMACLDAIARGEGDFFPILSDALKAEAPQVRGVAASLLWRAGDKALPQLVATLGDEDPRVRADAARALAHLDAKVAGPAATEALNTALSDGDESVRVAAARTAGVLGVSAAQDQLLAALGSDSATTRLTALHALERIGATDAIDAGRLADLREDSDPRVKAAAAQVGER